MLRHVLGVVALAAALLTGGCGDSGTTPSTTEPGTQAAGAMKVGLLVTGPTSDGGWNQLASESLKRLAAEQHLDVAVRQQVSKDAAPDAIRQFEAQGYGVVIAHGYEYLEAVKEITDPTRPSAVKIKVAVSGGDVASPNFQSLLYDLSGASYQLGVLAAKVSKTGKLGFIGGAPFPTVTAMKRGFEAGAKSVNPQVTVAAQYTGWDDPSKAKAQAEAFMEQGVDVIMQNVDAAGRGVFEAVKEHNEAKGNGLFGDPVYTFGANSDQNANPVCAKYTLASAVIKMDVAFGRVIQEAKDGTFKGGIVKEDLASGVSVVVVNPKLAGTVIDAETQRLMTEAGKKLASGEVMIPSE